MKYRDFFWLAFICCAFNVVSAQGYNQYTYNSSGHLIKCEGVGGAVADKAQSGDVIAQLMSGSGNICRVGIIFTSRAYTITISANGNTVVLND